MQLLQQESLAVLRKAGARFAKRRLAMKQDEAVIKNQIGVLSVDELPLMCEGVANRHPYQAGNAGNFYQIMTARSRQAAVNLLICVQ
jgi:hypothetical protein